MAPPHNKGQALVTPAAFHPNPPPFQPPEEPNVGDVSPLLSSPGIFDHLQCQAPRKGRNNEYQRRSQSLQMDVRADLDIRQAMSYVLSHKNFNSAFLVPDSTERSHDEPTGSFRPVGSLEAVNISAEKSEPLWRLEVERLVIGINNATTNVLFPETGIPDGDYSLLTSLAEDMRLLNSICQVFNESIVMEELPGFLDDDDYEEACNQLRLAKAFAEKEKAKNKPGCDKSSLCTRSSVQRQKSIFALINFMTLVLGRILVYSAPRNSTWCYACLSCLAKYTTELKVLTRDPLGFATLALRNAEDIAVSKRNSNNNPNNSRMENFTGLINSLTQQHTSEGVEDSLRNLYYGQSMTIQKQLNIFMSFVIDSLLGITITGAPLSTFEVSSIVYETGLRSFRTWVYQERNGDFQATSCQTTITMARPAFQLLQHTAYALKAEQKLRSRPPPPAESEFSSRRGVQQPLKTHLRWNDIQNDVFGSSDSADDYRATNEADIRTLAEAVTIIVPLCFVSPYVLTDLPDLFSSITKFHAPALPNELKEFKAFFSLFTDDQTHVNNRNELSKVSSLSTGLAKGLMTRQRLMRGVQITEFDGHHLASNPKSSRRHVGVSQQVEQLNQRTGHMWTLAETTVIVSCKLYVWTAMAFATVLVICGVIIGFTVRGRLEAVDPFNITTYCWVLAAFGILVAKSVRVETWPWMDFLHCRVRCRNVTELHSVTGIPMDFILCTLLDCEETSILTTRGPFNTVFERKNDSGFSIDRPMSIWSMLLSGLIMIYVNTERGPALVCLDVRRGTKYASVSHSGGGISGKKEIEQIVCTNLTRPDGLLPLNRQAIDCSRVVGLYNNRSAKFV